MYEIKLLKALVKRIKAWWKGFVERHICKSIDNDIQDL
jgi:hypothetical protein